MSERFYTRFEKRIEVNVYIIRFEKRIEVNVYSYTFRKAYKSERLCIYRKMYVNTRIEVKLIFTSFLLF